MEIENLSKDDIERIVRGYADAIGTRKHIALGKRIKLDLCEFRGSEKYDFYMIPLYNNDGGKIKLKSVDSQLILKSVDSQLISSLKRNDSKINFRKPKVCLLSKEVKKGEEVRLEVTQNLSVYYGNPESESFKEKFEKIVKKDFHEYFYPPYLTNWSLSLKENKCSLLEIGTELGRCTPNSSTIKDVVYSIFFGKEKFLRGEDNLKGIKSSILYDIQNEMEIINAYNDRSGNFHVC